MASDLSARLRDAYVDTKHGPSFRLSLDPIDLLAAADLIDQQAAEIERLKEGLRWYADPAIYKPHPHGLHFDDRDKSYHAKALLEEKPHD